MDAAVAPTKGTPLLFEIKGNSLDDGPGIRTVVFFKGCPLSCVWCHNPESQKPEAELSYDARRCAGCGRCMDTCTEDALAREHPYFIDRRRCTLCFACVNECPSGALARVGYEMSVHDVIQKVVSDKPFFDNSGGGVTLSGGEPTLYMEYASDLAKGLKNKGIHVLLETCGLFSHDRFRKVLYPYLDTIYYDIKLHDARGHKRFCGVTNAIILDNFVRILRDSEKNGPSVLPRTPLVPGITDTDANMKAIAGFLKENDVKQAALLPYNPLWHEKSWSIGSQNELNRDPKMNTFMAREKIERCKSIFAEAGLEI
jgi:pyruvate formate lyase activating enzyme